MKTKRAILKPVIVLCGAFLTTAVFGQTTYTWTGAADGTNFATAGNWNPVGLPSGAPQDTAQWDGVTTTNLLISYGVLGLPNTGFGTLGINLVLTPNQTNSVQIISPVFGSANLAVFGITNNSAAAAFTLGDGTASLLNLLMRPAGVVHYFVNNSAAPATINQSVRWLAGGGAAYVVAFGGTGDWTINNYLANDAGSVSYIQKDGPGAMTWAPTGYLGNSGFGSPAITVNAGSVILAGSHPRLVNQAIVNNATLIFDAASQSQTIRGVISGTGQLKVSNGTLTLTSANTYTGSTTLNGGELIVNSTENAGVLGPLGVGGTISFTGGTLGFSTNCTFDYSPRFSTVAGQAYKIDTAGQIVTFATGLGSSGGTLAKVGSGTLTLSGASSYSGATIVSAGKLVFQGSKSGFTDIVVADGAALGVTATSAQVTPATLTMGTSGSATLDFDNVTNTTTVPLAAGALSSAGTVTININSGTFTTGQSYPLLAWISGSAPPVSLGSVNGALGFLSTNGNTIQFNVTLGTLIWSGTNNGSWDTTTTNWLLADSPITYTNPAPVLLDDTAPGTANVTVNAAVQPSGITINNHNKNYWITSGSGSITGGTGLTKSGGGLLTLAGANGYTGVTTISGGTLSVGALANGGSPSDIGAAASSAANLVLDGGVWQYTGGGVSIDRLFTLGTGGGTIDASGTGALNLTNAGSALARGYGSRVLMLAGTSTGENILAAALSDSSGGGATALTKNGPGTWVLTGNNKHSGVTTIAAGKLQVGAGGATGSLGSGNVINNSVLAFNRSGQLIVGTISGSGSVTMDGSGTVFLAGDNTYAGTTTINSGTLSIGNGGATGKLNADVGVVNHGAMLFDSSAPFTLNGIISGTGSITKYGTGTLTLTANNTYTGNTSVSSGTLVMNGRNSASTTYLYGGALVVNAEHYAPIFAWGGNLGGTGVFYGPVTLNSGGGLAPGASGSVGSLTVSNNLIFGGRLVIDVNKFLSPSNDFVAVSGGLTNTGTGSPGMGSLTVSNLGPALAVGDKFTLFNKPMQNGTAVTVTGAGATWANNLAVDGSITATAVTRPTLNFTRAGDNLQFTWNTSFGNYKLQGQTNSVSVGISSNWADYPDGGSSPVTVPIGATNGAVFFRLISAP